MSAGGKATDVTMTSGSALIADSGATVEGTNASGKFSIDGTSGQASGLLLENGGSFTVNAGGLASNTTVGHRGTLTLAAGGSLSGRTQLSKGASMVLNGDVVSTGDIVNAGEIRFDNQTTPDAALSRAVAKGDSPVTFHKLTTSNLTGQGGTINMRVRLDGSNTSDQLVINGGQATGKTWLAFTNVGNSNLGVATSGQGIRVVDAQNGATTEEGAFALSRPLQAGAFNYTLNRDSDEDWYQMLPGYFRFVCQNGCVCGQSLGEVRVPHRGNVVEKVIEGAYEVVGVFDRIEEKRDAMQSLVLPPPARQALAQAALTYRYGDEHQPVTTADILTPRRREDYGKDLWSTYQTIQENMLKGGISGRSAKGKRIHTRAIHNIDTDIKLNRALWVMAETLLESLR